MIRDRAEVPREVSRVATVQSLSQSLHAQTHNTGKSLINIGVRDLACSNETHRANYKPVFRVIDDMGKCMLMNIK
jgi:hypothetical protein